MGGLKKKGSRAKVESAAADIQPEQRDMSKYKDAYSNKSKVNYNELKLARPDKANQQEKPAGSEKKKASEPAKGKKEKAAKSLRERRKNRKRPKRPESLPTAVLKKPRKLKKTRRRKKRLRRFQRRKGTATRSARTITTAPPWKSIISSIRIKKDRKGQPRRGLSRIRP